MLSCFGAYFCIGKNRDKTLRRKVKGKSAVEVRSRKTEVGACSDKPTAKG
jgi:hypothetical protein